MVQNAGLQQYQALRFLVKSCYFKALWVDAKITVITTLKGVCDSKPFTTIYLYPYLCSILDIPNTNQHEASRISQEIYGLQYHWVLFQWQDLFSPPPTVFSSLIHPDVYILPHRTARRAGSNPGQPISPVSSEVVTQQRLCRGLCSLLQHCSLTTFPEADPSSLTLTVYTAVLAHPCFFMGGRTRFPLNWKTWSCRTAANNGRTSGSVWSKDHLRHTCPTH